jgi:hypothetical protein
MMERHPGLMKIISAGLLDPSRARKATRVTRDAVFDELNAYILNLYCMNDEWSNFSIGRHDIDLSNKRKNKQAEKTIVF